MKRFPSLLFLAAIGCVSVGRPLEQSKLAQIKKGETTRDQIFAILGQPSSIGTLDGPEGKQTVIIYNYMLSTIRAESLLPYVGAFVGGTDNQSQTTTFTLDDHNVVKSILTSTGADKSGYLFSSQLPASTNKTVSLNPKTRETFGQSR